MTSSHEQNRYEALKNELRRLRRPAAPWYLESELHRRLHSPHRRTPYIGVGPILIIASTLVTFAIAVYVTLVNPLLVTQQGSPAPPANGVPVASADSQSTPVPAVSRSASAVSAAAPARRRSPAGVADSNSTEGRDSLRAARTRSALEGRAPADSIRMSGQQAPVAPEDTTRAK
jgi:hypothetical protein